MTTSFRMMAVMATFAGFPASISLVYCKLNDEEVMGFSRHLLLAGGGTTWMIAAIDGLLDSNAFAATYGAFGSGPT